MNLNDNIADFNEKVNTGVRLYAQIYEAGINNVDEKLKNEWFSLPIDVRFAAGNSYLKVKLAEEEGVTL